MFKTGGYGVSGYGVCAYRRTTLRVSFFGRDSRAVHTQQALLSDVPDSEKPWKSNLLFSQKDLEDQLELECSADTLRRVFLGPEATHRARAVNSRVYRWQFDKLRTLARRAANTRQASADPSGSGNSSTKRPRQIKWDTEDESLKLGQDLLRAQLHACVSPEDFTKVFTTALRSERWARLLANPKMQHIVLKGLPPKLNAGRVLGCLTLLIKRLHDAHEHVPAQTIWFALLIAARAHSSTAIRYFLKQWFDQRPNQREEMSIDRSIELVKALSAGYRRASADPEMTANRRAMTEIFFGFSDPAYAGQYHLQRHLPLFHPDVLSEWAPLSWEERAGIHIKQAWDAQQLSRTAQIQDDVGSLSSVVGDVICVLCNARHPEHAWEVFRTHGHLLLDAHETAWQLLFKHMRQIPTLEPSLLSKVQVNFMNVLGEKLTKLERSMNLKWVPSTDADEANGHHVPRFQSFDHTLLRLADPAAADRKEELEEQQKVKRDLAELIGVQTKDGPQLLGLRSFKNVPFLDARRRAQERELYYRRQKAESLDETSNADSSDQMMTG